MVGVETGHTAALSEHHGSTSNDRRETIRLCSMWSLIHCDFTVHTNKGIFTHFTYDQSTQVKGSPKNSH
jgi:hypothetical protein